MKKTFKRDEGTVYHIVLTLKKKTFENIVGKGENAINQVFLLYDKDKQTNSLSERSLVRSPAATDQIL